MEARRVMLGIVEGCVISPGTHTKLGFHIALFKFILIGYHRPRSRVFHRQSIQNPMALMESGEMED